MTTSKKTAAITTATEKAEKLASREELAALLVKASRYVIAEEFDGARREIEKAILGMIGYLATEGRDSGK